MARRGHGRRIAALAVVAAVVTLGGVAGRVEEPLPTANVEGARWSRATPLETLVVPPRAEAALHPPTAGGPPPAAEVAIAPPPPQFAEPPAPPAPPPPRLRSPFADAVPKGGTWAVMIGINDYPGGGHDLRSAVNDVHDVNEALARMGVPGDQRLLVRDRQATAEVIRTAVDWLVAHAARDATAVFFYAGHVRRLGGGTEAMVASDGHLVTDADLASRLRNLQAHRAWIGIAACYAGGFTEVLAPGRILTGAAKASDLAYENLDYGRSYLVEYMVRRAWLQGRTGPTVQDAFGFARAELARDHPSRVPVQMDEAGEPLDLRPPGRRTAAAPRSGSGSGSSNPPPPPGSEEPPPSSPPPERDGCENVTLQMVRCPGNR